MGVGDHHFPFGRTVHRTYPTQYHFQQTPVDITGHRAARLELENSIFFFVDWGGNLIWRLSSQDCCFLRRAEVEGSSDDVAVHISAVWFRVRDLSPTSCRSASSGFSLEFFSMEPRISPHSCSIWEISLFIPLFSCLGMNRELWLLKYADFASSQGSNAWETADWTQSGSFHMFLVLGSRHFSGWPGDGISTLCSPTGFLYLVAPLLLLRGLKDGSRLWRNFDPII